MARISTRLHGMLDYGSALILLAPWITDFFAPMQDTLLLTIAGSFTLLLSLLTNYEFGLIKLIPMRVHLFLDVITALFIIAIPFIQPLRHYIFYWPVLLGISELVIVLLSRGRPYRETIHETHISR